MSKKPLTRDEQFLAKAAGDDVPMPKPLTRVQEFLSGGKDLEDVPVTITPDGEPPVESTEDTCEGEFE